MLPSFTKAIALALSTAIVVVECSIVVPNPVAANTDFKLDLSTELSQAPEYDTYRILLNIAAKLQPDLSGRNHSYPTSCYLAKSVPVNSTSPTLQIPSSVGADDGSYAIVLEAYKEADISVDPDSGFVTSEDDGGNTSAEWVSNVFSLTGGTGKWSEAELDTSKRASVFIYADPGNVPCSAWNCARNCTTTFVGKSTTSITILGADYPTEVRDTWNCIGECQGVTYPTFYELFGLDKDYDKVVTSTVLGPLSTTATQTVFSTSVSFQSIPSTGLAVPTTFPNGTVTSVSASLSSTISRPAPTIATTPSPTNAASSIRLPGIISLLGSGFVGILLVGV
ncbi:hypothetical protein IFR05_007144 [Cadophora sp. M221]|nr:hypothetical protein IFR05_007144 [Cadophora sp. M221]